MLLEEAIELFFPLYKMDNLSIKCINNTKSYLVEILDTNITNIKTNIPLITIVRQTNKKFSRDRLEKEFKINQLANEYCIGPKILNVTPNYEFLHLSYIEGNHPKIGDPIDLSLLARTIYKFHSINLLDCPELNQIEKSLTFKRHYDRFDIITEKFTNLPQEIIDFFRMSININDLFNSINNNQTLCHLDIDYPNIIIPKTVTDTTNTDTNTVTDNLILIDYESSGIDNPFIDLAICSMYLGLTNEQELKLLDYYLQYSNLVMSYDNYKIFQCIAYISKITWPLVVISRYNMSDKKIDNDELNVLWNTVEAETSTIFSDINYRWRFSSPVDEIKRCKRALIKFRHHYNDIYNDTI